MPTLILKCSVLKLQVFHEVDCFSTGQNPWKLYYVECVETSQFYKHYHHFTHQQSKPLIHE